MESIPSAIASHAALSGRLGSRCLFAKYPKAMAGTPANTPNKSPAIPQAMPAIASLELLVFMLDSPLGFLR